MISCGSPKNCTAVLPKNLFYGTPLNYFATYPTHLLSPWRVRRGYQLKANTKPRSPE